MNTITFGLCLEPNASFPVVTTTDPLAELTNLTYLNLNQNGIGSLGKLSELKQLKWLDLSTNKLTDIKGIENLQKLEYLNIKDDSITDYSPLYKLKNLKELSVGYMNSTQLELLKKNLSTTLIK